MRPVVKYNKFSRDSKKCNFISQSTDFIGVLTITLSGLGCVIAANQTLSDGSYFISPDQAGLALAFALFVSLLVYCTLYIGGSLRSRCKSTCVYCILGGL